ncbi:MAG: glycosyltransferase [Lachnospiraceae bacterium]|jgi:glycosyltransferase involved in cell wall biosynthesis|nr:glycosyltransferase [Lachnospiraceae bacterium]
MERNVSVILASYNQGDYLGQSIQSILQQTYKDFELIIIDDCSTDNSWEIIKSFKDSRIRAHRNERNLTSIGVGMVKHAVENWAKGKYVAIQHSCDFWEKDKLEKQVRFLENDQEKRYGAVFTLVNVVTETGEAFKDTSNFYYNIFEKNNRNRFEWLRYFFDYGNCLCHNSVLIRKEYHKKYHLFVKGLRQTPDFYKWVRLCLNKEIYIIQEHLTGFRMIHGQRGASRYNVETSVRSSVEMFFVVQQYSNLKRYEDFVQVFPEIKTIMDEKNFNCDFALAWICLLPGRPNYYRLYGYQLIYNLLNDRKKIGVLMREFHYGSWDFWNEDGKVDIFGLFPQDEEKICSLFLDTGDGYSEQMSIKKVYRFGKREQYEFTFYLSKKDYNGVKKMRLDPIEETFIVCRVVKACWGKIELKIEAVSEHALSEEGTIFLTTDPNYEIVIPEEEMEGTISVILEMKRIEDVQLEKYLLEGKK